jgi:GNAT superfamily N-acetyltransferase
VSECRIPIEIRPISESDFFWLRDYDCRPLNIERDSIYLFFCVHFAEFSLVAWDIQQDLPCGFLLGFLPTGRDVAYIHYLFVEEGHRRTGIATRLVRAFERNVADHGGRRVGLYTARAQRFYMSLGYVESTDLFGKAINEYVQREKRVVVMMRALA